MAEKVGRESPFKGVMEKLSSIESMVEKISGMKADIDIDTSDIDKANDELDKFNEKLAEAQKTLQRFNGTGQIRYFATQEKALAHLTKAWEEYKKASSEDDKKSAGRRLMIWAHAYQGAGYSTKDIDKEMFDAADRVYASFKTTGKKGESNSMRMYSKEAFEEIFEAARTAGVDPSDSDKYWEKRYYQEAKAIHRGAQKAAEQTKSEPVELDVAELFKIDESGLKARMDKLKKSVKKIRDKLIDENGERTDKSLGKNQGAQFLKDLFELDKYNKDTGQLALKGSTKAFKIVLEEMGLKNDLKGDLKPFMSEAEENYKNAIEKARRAVKKAGINPKPSSTKGTPSEGASTESKSQPQKPMTQSAEDSKAAGEAADDAAKSFQKAAGAAEEAGDRAANSAARTRESAEETREAAEETREAAQDANEAQRQASESHGNNGAAEDARETTAALNEERDAARGVNEERERSAAASGSGDNTASRARENADALEEERKAQQEVNDERSKGSGSSGQDEEPLSYLDSIILKLEEEKKKLKELQEESDKTRKLLDATADTEVLEKVRGIVRGRAYNEETKEWETFEGFEGNPEALGSLVKRKISEGNMAKAAAYYGEYAKAGGTDKFSDLTGKDITAELAERYRQAAEAIGKNPDELRKALNEVNKKILTQREVVNKIQKEVKAAQKEAAAQRKEQAQQEQETNTDWQNGLNEQEIEAVEAYLKKMKALKKEAYNESTALAQAMSLLEKIKKRDISGLMDKFTAPNQASNAMLGKMTNMSVNNQKARNAALRSLNQEEYDRLIQEQTQAVNDALDNKKSDFQQKWAEVADAMLGGDAFADAKPMVKGQILKELEKYADTAKDAIDEINKQWLSGTLDESKFSGKYAKQYIQMLNDAMDDAQIKREAKVGELDPDSLFSSGGTTALTQEQVDALHAEAAAYDDLIAKKKEYYGIKDDKSLTSEQENNSQIKLRGTLEEVEQAYKDLTAAKEAYDKAKETKDSFAGVTEQSALIRERRRRSYDAYDSAVTRYQEAFDKYNGFFGSKQDAEEWGRQYDAAHVKEAMAQEEDSVARSQAAIRAEIDETNEIIKEQEAWFDRVKQVNDELTFTHKNKRQALKELKQTSAEYKELKENPDNFDEIETARRIFRYQNAGTHAEQLGLDPEVISQYWTKLPLDQFKEETRKFAEESARRNAILYEAKERLQELTIEYNKAEVAALSSELGTTIRKEQNKINREIKAYENGVLETQSHENQKLILEKYDNAPRKSSAEFLDFQSTEEYSKLDERGKSLVDGLIQAYQKLEMIKKDGGLEYLQMLKQEKELTEEISDVREKLFNAQDSERNGDKVDATSLLSEKETIDSIIEKLKLLDSEKAKTYGIFGTSKHEAGTGDIQKQIDSLIQAKNDIDAILERVGQSAPSSSNASTFAADIKSLEGYSSANEDFVNQLIADVIAGQKEYDQAMNELKTHIAQRQEEIRAEEELSAKRVRNAGFGEDVKALENYGYADKDFVQKLTAQVLEGTKEYDDAMDELKTHIEQKHTEMMAAAEKSERDNAEIARYDELAKPMLEQMGFTDSRPEGFYRFVEAVREEGIDAEEALKRFADTFGYVYDQVNERWARPASRKDTFLMSTIEGYEDYIDKIAGKPELNAVKIAWDKALEEKDFQGVLDIVQKINEAFRQGKLDAEGYVEGVGYLDGMDWAKYYARYLTKDDKHGHGARYLDEVPEGWKKIEGALTAPKGYEWYSNGKSRFSGEYQQALVKIKEAVDDVTESERQMGQAGEEAAAKVTKVTGDAYNDDLKSFARINSDILEEPKYEYDYDKLIERGGQLEQILTKVFDENPGTTLQTVIDTVQQELTDAQGRAKELDDTLKQIREGSKKWSFNDMLNDPDAFADDLNKLTEQLIALREAGKGDTKEALNLETRIQHMLAAQGKVFDQPNKKAFMPYFEKVQSKLTDGAKSIQDEMWEAMANGGNLTSRNDFPSLVADRLGLGIEYNKDFLADDIRELQSLLDILQHIDTVRGRISDQGKIDFFGKQVDRNLRIAKELEERLQGTSEEDRAYDPEWVENQYKYIAEHLQKAEELKKKIAELKGEVYEMQTFTAESVKAQLTQQQPEDPVENFKKTWTKAALKATEPPETLSQAYMQYIKDINSGAISAEDAMAGMEQVAKRLDVAFDEASQKWQKIQFSPEIQANLDAFNKALPSFEDGVSAKTFDDTKKKYEDLVYAIKYESKSAEEAIQEMLAAIKEAAAANGDLYGQEPSKSETPNRKFLVSATTPHAAKATYIKRTIAEDTDTSVEDLGEDISDVGGRAAEAVGNLDSFTKSAKNAAEAARKAAGIEGESRIISRSGVNGTSASATYELARGMHYTENWSYRNGNEETGEEPGWAMTSARYVINYQALLNDTITTMKQLAKAEADLALAQEQGRGENVTSQIQKQIGLYRTRIDQNAKLAEQYERMGDLEDELVLRDGYTKRQYDEDLKAQEELINAQSGAKKAKSVDDERKRQAEKQDKEVARAQKYATERLVALKQLESSFTTEGSSRYLSAEDDRTAITDMAGKLRTKLEDIIKQNRAMTIDEMDDIITQFGDIKVEGDTRYSRSTAKKGDLSRQKVDSLKNVLSSDLDAFSQQAQRSSGDISHITEEVNKLKEALNGNVSSEFITESFQKLRELRAELKAINEEQRTKTSTEKARQAEIKLVAELQESYIKLADAEEKRDHASTETGRELGRRQSDQIKKRQEELKKRVESTLGKDFANKAVAEAETEANKLRTAYANDRNEGISTKGLGFGENDDVERTWDTLIAKAQQYQKILYKQQPGGTITVNEAALLQKLSDLYQQAGEKAEEAGEKGQKFNEAVAAAQQAVRDSVISKYSETIGGLTAGNKNMPEAYNKQVEELKNNLEQLKNIDFDTTEWKKMVGNLDAGLNNLRTDASMRPVTDSQKAQLDRQMASWMNSNSGAGEFLGQVQRLRDALSNVRAEDEFNGIQSDFEKVRAAAADAGKTGESFGAGLKKRFKSLGQYLLSFASFYRVIGVIKQAFNTVKQLDDALTEMRKVSDESLSSLKKYQSLSFDMADEVGTTSEQIQKSTADWLRLGESFEEAQKSAKESTILLNVSEFDNIDKATEALVSASQAYKDLDKIDIIDKLNNIGNNFSISTDQLATGLQNAAAVLMTQGNDIDEALALLTAGNAITQDISKTSAGIRTISLRISGTEEAKDEIQDMGEDIDDFVVRTKSKTDSIIRDYTAVASNAYKGVSVLDANGNLRNTYDILLDIAKIYKEIQAEDKKNGTNRAQALVETLAGLKKPEKYGDMFLRTHLNALIA